MMRTGRRLSVVALCLVAFAAPRADAGGGPLFADLDGASEVPGPGDPDGVGFVEISLNPGQDQVCFEMFVDAIDTPTAAHIHEGTVGVAGPIVVPLFADNEDPSSHFIGCVSADRNEIGEILRGPEEYYVNVHNADSSVGPDR